MATFDYGAFYFWGDNENGQLGNRKRSFIESPFPKRKFELFHDVVNVIADVDSSAVIVETQPPRQKKKKSKKRVLTLVELQQMSEDRIKAENELRLNAKKKKEEEEVKAKQVSLDMRIRGKLSELIYGSEPIIKK